MFWEEVIELYGAELAEKMKHSEQLCCITVRITEDGSVDYPSRDIDLAYRDVMGLDINPLEWD